MPWIKELGLFMGASALVVSNDAPLAVKAVARVAKVALGNRIQICDGVDDQVEINAAYNALSANGGRVLLFEGIYVISGEILPNTETTLEGQGAATIIKVRNNHSANLDTVKITSKEKITITRLKLDGNKANNAAVTINGIGDIYGSSDILVEGCWLENFTGVAVKTDPLSSCYRVIITNNHFYDTDGGITIDLAFSCAIANNTFHVFASQAILCDEGRETSITGNIIDGGTPGGAGERGIELARPSQWNSITGNIIRNVSYGLLLSHDAYAEAGDSVSHNSIIGNTFHKCGGWAIRLITTAGTEHCRNNVVANNTISHTTEYAIILNNAEDNLIEGNELYENANGRPQIWIDNNSNKNVIRGNVIRKGTVAPTFGISVDDDTCTRNIIEDNDLRDSGLTALNDLGTLTEVQNNKGTEITDDKIYRYVKCPAGAVTGQVVILKAVAAGNEVEVTTTKGDDNVYGMVAEGIAPNGYGLVQVGGKTTVLKVNGVVDIAIGDFLTTYTVAGIACKASPGDMSFARALEAYATDDSSGVIDAYLFSSLKV